MFELLHGRIVDDVSFAHLLCICAIPSNRQHLSNDDCLENYIGCDNCSVQYDIPFAQQYALTHVSNSYR